MAVNAVIAVLGALALAGAGVGMATMAAGPLGMPWGGCNSGQGGCHSNDGSGCAGAQGNPACQKAACNPNGTACSGLQDGTCPYYNGTEND
jgi:hypothetical protein